MVICLSTNDKTEYWTECYGRIFDPNEYREREKKPTITARSIWKIAVENLLQHIHSLDSYCNRKLSKEIIRSVSLFASDSNQHWLWATIVWFYARQSLLPILTLTFFAPSLIPFRSLSLSLSHFHPHSQFPFSRAQYISSIKSSLYFIRSLFHFQFECCIKKGYILYNGADSVADIPHTSSAFDCWTMPFRSGRGTKMDTHKHKITEKNLILKPWMTLVCVCEYF